MRIFALFFLTLVACCSSSSVPGQAPPESENHRPPVTLSVSHGIGFARTAKGFAAFDVASGVAIADVELGGAIVDLDWDEARSRLLVVELLPELEESVVHSFGFANDTWKLLHTSSSFVPETRVVAGFGQALALSEDLGVSWSLLGPELEPTSFPGVLGRPSSITFRSQTEVVALDPHGGDASAYLDIVRRVRLDSQSLVESITFEAEGRPQSRWTLVDEGRRALVVRKMDAATSFQIGRIELGSPLKAPDFYRRVVPGAHGSLVDVVFDQKRSAVVALLSRAAFPAVLVTMPLSPEQSARVIELGAPVDDSTWMSRELAYDPVTGALLVATVNGVRAFQGNEAISEFSGESYFAPIVVKDTW
jgi:hypothetical protein